MGVRCLYSDEDVVSEVSSLSSEYSVVLSIDAPFSLGRGLRAVDRRMISLGYRVLPPSFKAMRGLTLRAIELLSKLSNLSIRIYETHPRSALSSSRCSSISELLDKLSVRYGLDVDCLSKDLRDAVVAAVASYCVDSGYGLVVEDVDGAILLIREVCR